jgi:hypothetical protein
MIYTMIWYIIYIISYICLLQYGYHPVAVVQYTFTPGDSSTVHIYTRWQ